jgi:branched-chain amino acid transport system substrate-binding protein
VVRAREGAAVDRGLNTPARLLLRALVAVGLAAGPAAAAGTPGVTPSAVVVGTHLDLTGPLAELGTAVRNGIVMAFDEANAAGGVNGRRLRLIAADDGYNVRKAVAATKSLLYRDHVFAILNPVGTLQVAKTLPFVLGNGTLHLFPFTPAEDRPMQPFEFTLDLPVSRQIALGLNDIISLRGPLQVGILARKDALGSAVMRGAAEALLKRDEHPVAVSIYQPGETNFTRSLVKLREAGAELVVLGGTAEEAITAMQQAQAQGWIPVFLCNGVCYVPQLPTLGGRAVSGLYAVAATPIPYPDDKDKALRAWVRRYERRFGTVASQQAFRAYLNARVFIEALRRAGPDPTQRRVAHALETFASWRDPEYGGIPVTFSVHDHLGVHSGFLAQVRGGRWTTLTSDPPRN